jgi:hypothetical protein
MSHAPIGPTRASFTGGSHDRVHDAGELPSLLADLHAFSGEVARWAAVCVYVRVLCACGGTDGVERCGWGGMWM